MKQACYLQVLFPPLTYLQPTGRVQIVTVGESNFKVVEVTPKLIRCADILTTKTTQPPLEHRSTLAHRGGLLEPLLY